jgi:hypothetical protein
LQAQDEKVLEARGETSWVGQGVFVTDFAMGSFIVLMAGMKLSIEVAPSFVHFVKFLSATSNFSQVSSVSFFWNRAAIRLISRSNSNSVEIYGQFIQ